MHRNNDPPPVDDTRMGRPPTVTEAELVVALQAALDWPAVAAVGTDAVAAEIDAEQQTVRNRLRACHNDTDSPITGLRSGGQGGWVWWLTDETLYDN
jgi:hypothetical protein